MSSPAVSPDDLPLAPEKKRLRLLTRLSQRAILALLMLLTRMVQGLPRPAAMRFGVRLGRLGYRIASRPRRIALRNLRLVYGDSLDDSARAARVLAVFEHFGKCAVDFLQAPQRTDAAMDGLVTAVEGWENVEAARAAGRGVIVVTGHVGNFELLGRWMAFRGVPSTAVARDPVDPALAAYTRRMREYGGNEMIHKGTSARDLLKRLKGGAVITLGVDQNSGDIFLPFLGVPAGTVTGPAKLALHTGAPLLPAFCIREPDDTFRMVFLPAILPDKTADRDDETVRLTTAINTVLETVVEAHPEQWLWLHNRWKSAFEAKNAGRRPAGFDYVLFAERWGEG